MKTVLIILTFALAISAQTSVNSLAWMMGCWELKDGSSVTTEQWMKPLGGMMLGISRTVKNGKATWHEYTRVVEKDNELFFVARPASAKEDTFFKLAKQSATESVFENLEHDFPQRIIYRKTGKNAMFARIEGTMNGKLEGEDFPYTRVKCE